MRLRVIKMRMDILEKRFVELDKFDVERADPQRAHHAVAMIAVFDMHQPDFKMRRFVIARPGLQHNRLVAARRFLI